MHPDTHTHTHTNPLPRMRRSNNAMVWCGVVVYGVYNRWDSQGGSILYGERERDVYMWRRLYVWMDGWTDGLPVFFSFFLLKEVMVVG